MVVIADRLPNGLIVVEADPRCTIAGAEITCRIGRLDGAARDEAEIHVAAASGAPIEALEEAAEASEPAAEGTARNPLLSGRFTLENFAAVVGSPDFWPIVTTTIAYSVGGTVGSVVLGLFAALLLDRPFRGRAALRGLFQFPYVAPVIAVAFTWVYLLDPFSGTLNSLATRFGAVDAPVNFLGVRSAPVALFGLTIEVPVALLTDIAFSSWSYFPLAFPFIMGRLQALPEDLKDAAKIDGATPIQTFLYVTLPQLMGVLLLAMLRFIWTFNKFEDIFLLTGGAAGTRTLTVDVYEQGFAIGNLGAGAAVSVIIFLLLLVFVAGYMRALARQEAL